MALPILALAGLAAAGAYSAQRQQKKQNQANAEAFERQHFLEKEQDLRNQEGVMARLMRPFERSVMTPGSQRLYLGGLNESARALSSQIMAKQAEYEALDSVDGQAPTGETAESLMADIRELTAQKDSVEFQALEDSRTQYTGLMDQADLAGRGIFTGDLLASQQAAFDPMQTLRAGFDPYRKQANVGLEGFEEYMTDPNRLAAQQALALERAQATEDPVTQQLRLEATDAANLANIQDLRRQEAENIVANANQTSNELANRLGARRAYGGSSTATNRGQADIMLGAMQAASRARLGARMQNAEEDEAWRQSRIQAQVMNQADNEALEQSVLGARLRNEGSRLSAQREQDVAGLNALKRRLQTGLTGMGEAMQTADERRQLIMQNEALKLANLNLPSDLLGQRQAEGMGTEIALQKINAMRMSPMTFSKIGPGNYMPPQVPVKKVTAGGLGIALAAAKPLMGAWAGGQLKWPGGGGGGAPASPFAPSQSYYQGANAATGSYGQMTGNQSIPNESGWASEPIKYRF